MFRRPSSASGSRKRFKTDMVEALMPRYFRKETERLSLHPISQPRVTDLHLHDGEPLRFKASFEVLPEIKSRATKNCAPRNRKSQFPMRMWNSRSKTCANSMPLSMPSKAARSPTATSLRSRSMATPKQQEDGTKPVHMDEVLVEIGGKNTMPEFTEHLRGANPGDERTFDVIYPEDSQDKRLAGKTFSYAVRSRRSSRRALPELNDDFAKELGEFQTHGRCPQAHSRRHGSRTQARSRARGQRKTGRRTDRSAMILKSPMRWSSSRSTSAWSADCARWRRKV